MLKGKPTKRIKQNIGKIKIAESKKLPKLSSIKPVTNTIIHGDTLQTLKKIPSNKINLIITSPSYMLGKEYDREKSLEEYKEYHSDVIKECHRVLTKDGALYWNVAQKPWDGEILPLGAIFYEILKKKKFYLKNWIIWHFEGGLNAKKRLSGRYENIPWMVKDKENFVFNLDDIRIPAKWHMDKRCNPKGKNPTDFWTEVDYVWDINRVVNVSKEKTAHPTQFPEKMIKRIIKSGSNKDDIVMDIFSGSGTVMKVAEEEGRKWIGIDKELKYCKIALKRVMSSTSK